MLLTFWLPVSSAFLRLKSSCALANPGVLPGHWRVDPYSLEAAHRLLLESRHWLNRVDRAASHDYAGIYRSIKYGRNTG